MWCYILLIVSHLSLYLSLILLCKAKKTTKQAPTAPIPAPNAPKPEEKPEGEKKQIESETKKTDSDSTKKDAEKKEEKVDEKIQQTQEDSKKDEKEEKKESDEEKGAYMPKNLHWKSEDGTVKYGVQKILLMNTIGKRQAFKMKCTDNNIYTVKPLYTFLEKDEVVDIEVTRVEGGEVKEDTLFLFYTTVDDDRATDAELLFNKEDDAYQHYTVPLIPDV